ncbi:MAG: hypothetical protein ACK5MG_00390 [Bacteroidales bacterium]
MNKIFWVFAVVSLGFLTSCTFAEEISFNADGSGKIVMSLDGSQAVAMMGSQIQGGDNKAMDSTIFIKDLIEKEGNKIPGLSELSPEKLETLKKVGIYILMNTEAKKMNFDMFSDFDTANDINKIFEAFREVNEIQKKHGKGNGKMPADFGSMFGVNDGVSAKVQYEFKGKTFKRTTIILDEKLLRQNADSLARGEASMFLSNSKYSLKYHFPKKIESVSPDKVMISADGKTMMLEVNFSDYLKDPKILDVEVKLK